MKTIIRNLIYIFILIVCIYFSLNYTEYIKNFNLYKFSEKIFQIVSFFATIGGFCLSVNAIYKVVEFEEELLQKEINKGFILDYKKWLEEAQINGYHTKLFNDLTSTVKQHMDHVGRFKRRRLKKELKSLTKHKKKAEKQNKDVSKILENSLNCFIKISKIYNNGE